MMTLSVASSAMQSMAIVFVVACMALRTLRIIQTHALMVGLAMGAVLIACAGVLSKNAYLAGIMFSVHLASALVVILGARGWTWDRLLRRRP